MKARKKPPTQAKPAPAATRWYAPDEKAFKRLVALGAPSRHIYRGWKGELPGKFKMRQDEYLGVVDGLRALGKTKRPISQAVAMIHSWGATVLDVETGKDSCRHGISMLHDALKPPMPTKEYQAKLREERREAWRQKHGVMPKEQAYTIWRHPTMKVHEKLELMDGWTKDRAYQEFKETGRPGGRPRKVET